MHLSPMAKELISHLDFDGAAAVDGWNLTVGDPAKARKIVLNEREKYTSFQSGDAQRCSQVLKNLAETIS